jgi:hypothetical protein
MNRKQWKQSYKRFTKNKLKNMRTKLSGGKSMQRHPTKTMKRRETI